MSEPEHRRMGRPGHGSEARHRASPAIVQSEGADPEPDLGPHADPDPDLAPGPDANDARPLAALSAACAVLGDRWSLPIVAALLDGPLRYGELQGRLPAIAPNILTARLRSLAADGLVVAARYSDRPPRFEYRLTGDGSALADAVRLLAGWAAARADPPLDEPPLHAGCGTPLEVRWWCPTCETVAAARGEPAVFV